MHIQQPLYTHLQRKKVKFRKVKWIVQTYPSRKWQNQDWSHFSWFLSYTTVFLCTRGLNEALQSSLIPLKLWKWLKYPEVSDPSHTPGGIKSKTNNINKIRYLFVCMLSCFSRVWLLATLRTVAHQTRVHSILQARIWESVAISFTRGSSQPRDRIHVSHISCIGRQVLYHKRQLRIIAGKVSEVLVPQSCPTLYDPMDYSPPGSCVHEIFQARIL